MPQQPSKLEDARGLIAYSDPFIPAEWIAAHGLRPSRALPSAAGGGREGLCPYAWAFVQSLTHRDDLAGAVFTSACGQMRRATELPELPPDLPAHVFHLPTTWQTVNAQRIYMDELRRLGQLLIDLGGHEPTTEALRDTLVDYDARRRTLRGLRGQHSPRAFSEAIARFHEDGSLTEAEPAETPRADAVPLALVGGPMLREHFDLFDLIEGAGGTVALDATESGERGLPGPLDLRAVDDDPFLAMVDMYFNTIPEAFQRPNSRLYAWFKKSLEGRGVRGIIFRCATWCDTWHAEAQRMKEWADVPLLLITTSGEERIASHTVSRIEAFLEMLR